MNDLMKKKIEYASNVEKLFIILNNTDQKFKNLIKAWKENDKQSYIYASKLSDNIIELRCSLNTENENPEIQKALENIGDLYEYILSEIFKATPNRDVKIAEDCYKVFTIIKSIFEEDRRRMSK